MLSCIMPSKPSRIAFAQRSILDFLAMLVESPSVPAELLVVVGDEEYAARLRGFLANVIDKAGNNMKCVTILFSKYSRVPYECILHALCNASGTHVSFWDDADKHAKRWLHFMSNWCDNDPTGLIVPTRTLYHFYETRETYVCDFHDADANLVNNAVLSNVIYPRKALPQFHSVLREDPYLKTFQAAILAAHPVFPDQRADGSTAWLHMVGVANDELHDRHRANVQRKNGVLPNKEVERLKDQLLLDLAGFYGDRFLDLSISGSNGPVFAYEYQKLEQSYPGRILPLPKYATESKESDSDDAQTETKEDPSKG